MKKPFTILLFFVSCALVAQTSTARENALKWIVKMNAAYSSAKSVAMTFSMDYYELASQQVPTSSTKGELRYSGLNYYSDAMGQILLVNKRFTLLVDKEESTITCLPGRKLDKKEMHAMETGPVSGMPDSSWLSANSLRILGQNGTSVRIEIIGKDGIYEKTELQINTTTNELEKITSYYSQTEDGTKPKLVITYSSVHLSNAATDADFSEKTFIRKTNGKLSPAPAWKNYELIDLTSGTN